MKLYRKQLHSLEELRREKHVLKYAMKHTDDWLSFKEMDKGDSGEGSIAGAGLLGTIISALGSKSTLSMVMAIAPPILAMFSKRSSGDRKKKNPVESLAKDLIIGYIKWKAISLGYKAVRNVTKGSKEKHHKEKEHA